MTRRGTLTWILVVFWLISATGFVVAALRQKERLNLSATAGGQMPYLVYAQDVAVDGLFGHFGDRNRMPLVPVLVSLVYDADWLRFANRASWLAIGLSLALLAAMACIAYRNLSPLMATAFLLIVAVAVLLPQASFIQADVPYYAMFFCSWWFMVRLIARPGLMRAVALGLLLALTYLTKASILLALPVLLAVLILRAVASSLRKVDESGQDSEAAHPVQSLSSSGWKRPILAGLVTTVVFLAAVFPYLQNNKARYGRYFYNVNTTFFVWCDRWAQAQRFAEEHKIDQQFPVAPAESIPGPLNYWRTHTVEQIGRRLAYGLTTLGTLALESSSFKYVLLLAAGAGIVSVMNPTSAKRMIRAHRWAIGFSAVLSCAYVLAYSWYVVVAYGDRFVLSLVPPVLFALCYCIDRAGRGLPVIRIGTRFYPASGGLAAGLILLTLADGMAAANTSLFVPSPTFVRFYYDETHEELRRGNLEEAKRGMSGVLALDPHFAAAHRDLGMIALRERRHEDAIASLSQAATLEPDWADVQNSLGSALILADRLAEAVAVLERATALEPGFAPAWYNLCGVLIQLKRGDEADRCVGQLERVSPELAQNLRETFNIPDRNVP